MTLEENLKRTIEKIETAKKKHGLKQHVEIVAATKTRQISIIQDCYKLGITTIGENRIQEAEEKFIHFHGFENIKKRFIGHLQTNKVKKCLNIFDTVDSIDTTKLAKKLNAAPKKNKKKVECLLEINTSKEPQKKGFPPKLTKDLVSCFNLPELNIVGLMTIGPNTRNEKQVRNSFSELRKLKDKINKETGINGIKELSMGMTNDFEIGVQEGATMIRLGTGLFGKR